MFAVLGLMSPTEREQWAYAPDYTLPINQTYINASASYMIAHQNLDLLRLCELRRRQHLLKLPSWAVDCEMLKHFPRRLNSLFANADLKATLLVETDILIASGVIVDAVETAARFGNVIVVEDADAIFEAIQNTVRYFHLTHLDVAAVVSVLVGGDIVETQDRPIAGWPTRALLRKVIDLILCTEPLDLIGEWSSEMGQVFGYIKVMCSRRSMIRTKSGLLGIAPEATKMGDVVVVLFGYRNPFLLRPVQGSSGEFQVVGECYADSIMGGEMILGSLLEQYELILEDFGFGYNWASCNNETGEILERDPRYQLLLGKDWPDRPEWTDFEGDDRSYWDAVAMECMKVRGVRSQEIRIV